MTTAKPTARCCPRRQTPHRPGTSSIAPSGTAAFKMASGKGTIVVGADDIGAVVVDCGSWSVRFGNAGDDAPRAIVPSAAGTRRAGGLLAGDSLLQTPGATLDISPTHAYDASTGDATVRDWDAMRAVWSAAYRQLHTEPSSGPLLIVEPTRQWADADRAKALEVAFEGLQVPAAYVARGSAMAAFAAARTTACVVDVGHQGACAVPVAEGYALGKSTRRSAVGGRLLSGRVAEWLDAQLKKMAGDGDAVMQDVADAPAGGEAATAAAAGDVGGDVTKAGAAPPVGRFRALHEVRGVPAGAGAQAASETHRSFFRLRALHQMKASVLRVTPRGSDSLADAEAAGRAMSYTLPDGQTVDLRENGGLDLAGALFRSEGADKRIRGLANLAFDAVSACDTDIRRELYGGVVLTGGCSVIPGVLERFTTDLAVLTPQAYKLKVVGTQNSMERASGPWIGGSIVASLGTFQSAWVSKKEYDELGGHGALRKCP